MKLQRISFPYSMHIAAKLLNIVVYSLFTSQSIIEPKKVVFFFAVTFFEGRL